MTSAFVVASLDGYFDHNDIKSDSFYGEIPDDHPEVDLDAMWSF